MAKSLDELLELTREYDKTHKPIGRDTYDAVQRMKKKAENSKKAKSIGGSTKKKSGYKKATTASQRSAEEMRKQIQESRNKIDLASKMQSKQNTNTQAALQRKLITDTGKTDPALIRLRQKSTAENAVPKFIFNTVEGLGNALTLGQFSRMKNEDNPYSEQMRSGTAATAGRILGEGLGFLTGTGAAASTAGKAAGRIVGSNTVENAIGKITLTKAGQRLGENAIRKAAQSAVQSAISDSTVGLAQNIGIARAEGLEGADLIKDVAKNQALDYAIGGVAEALPMIGRAISSRRASRQTANQTARRATGQTSNVNQSAREVAQRATTQNLPQQNLQALREANQIVRESTGNQSRLLPNGADVNKNPPSYKQSTAKANDYLPENEQYRYQTETHKERNRAATERLQVDREGEYKDLTNKDYYTSEDFATASKLFNAEIDVGNTSRATHLMKKIAEQSSQKGQDLEAVKHIKENTPGGKIYKAQSEVTRVEKIINKNNPKLVKKAKEDIKDMTNVIKSAYKDSKDKDEFIQKSEEAIDKFIKGRGKNNPKKVPLRNDILDVVKSGDNIDDILDDVSSLIKEKNGIPALTKEKSDQIIDNMRKAQNATDDYMRRMYEAKADQIIADIEPATAHDKFRSAQRIGMLSNLRTLITRNGGGNFLFAAAENVKDIPASIIDRAVSLKTGERTVQGLTTEKIKAQASGIKKGVSEQIKDIKYGVDTSTSRSAYELPNKTVWDPSRSKTKAGRVATHTMNFLDKFIGKALQFGDRPFYEAAYNARKSELESLIRRGKHSAMTVDEIEEDAKLHALDRVFQGNSAIAKRASKIRSSLGVIGDIAIPFTQTPSNIVDKLIDYSPAGIAKAMHMLGKTKKGTFNQKKFVDTLGRTFTGSGVLALGYALADKDMLTTDIYNPEEYDKYKAESSLGRQSFSLKLGDDYYSIDWANPVGSLLIMGAEMNEVGFNNQDVVSSIFGTAKVGVDSVLSQSFLQGLSDLFSGESFTDSTIDLLLSAPTQLVPNVLNAVTKVVDPVKRETYDENPIKQSLNEVIARIPGLSKTLPAKVGITGEEVEQYQGRSLAERLYESFIAPYNKSTEQKEATQKELLRLYKETGSQSVLLNTAGKKFTYNGVDYNLKTGKELSDMQKDIGQYAMKELKTLFDSSEYKKMSNSEKADAVSKIQSEAQKKAYEKYLVDNKILTKKDIDYENLTNSKQDAVDKYNLNPSTVLKASEKVKESGVTEHAAIAIEIAEYGDDAAKAYNNIAKSTLEKGRVLSDLGVTGKQYEKASNTADTNSNGRVSKAEAIYYLNQKKWSREKKRAMFSAMCPTANNPY